MQPEIRGPREHPRCAALPQFCCFLSAGFSISCPACQAPHALGFPKKGPSCTLSVLGGRVALGPITVRQGEEEKQPKPGEELHSSGQQAQSIQVSHVQQAAKWPMFGPGRDQSGPLTNLRACNCKEKELGDCPATVKPQSYLGPAPRLPPHGHGPGLPAGFLLLEARSITPPAWRIPAHLP